LPPKILIRSGSIVLYHLLFLALFLQERSCDFS